MNIFDVLVHAAQAGPNAASVSCSSALAARQTATTTIANTTIAGQEVGCRRGLTITYRQLK